jgi:4-hydroxybenzoate polyprenyltransferase
MSVQADSVQRVADSPDASTADPEGPGSERIVGRDPLFEAALAYVKSNPARLFETCWWAAKGSDHLTARLLERNTLAIGARRSDATSVVGAANPARVVEEIRAVCYPARGGPGDLLKSLRLHQWTKNLLVFVPIVLAGQLTHVVSLEDTVIAFFALSIVASSTYLVNDMWDLADDRRHWSKRHRPIASGRLPISTAAATVPFGILIGFFLAAMTSPAVVWLLLVYLVITTAYTFGLKRIVLIDGVVLAVLFTLRLAIGVAAADVPPSAWLVVFSMFLFASLSYAKRHTEIARVAERRGRQLNGRGYRTSDAPIVLAMGLSTGVGAVLILVLYIVHDAYAQTFYGNTVWLWAFPPLVFLFVARIWLACLRGELDDDPVAFALTDRACLGLLVLGLICFGLAWLGPAWR